MANGMASAKQAADYVTTSHDEDGVALAIERFVLGE
jgi:hydroxymethylpyrimidine pyrophosphatase-like HAD family hydrolase